MTTYYKAVRLDHTSHWDGKTFWKEGEITTPDLFDPDPNIACGHGLHICKSLMGAVRSQEGSSEYCLVEPLGTQVIGGDKIRCEKVKCIRFLEQEETDDIAGFKLWEASHPVNPLLLERDETLDLEKLLREWIAVPSSGSVIHRTWGTVRDTIPASILDTVRSTTWATIWPRIRSSVWGSFWGTVPASVLNAVQSEVRATSGDLIVDTLYVYIGGLFSGIKKWKYVKGPDPWRPMLTLWYGGYLPSFDGKTWRLHVGPKAEIILELEI